MQFAVFDSRLLIRSGELGLIDFSIPGWSLWMTAAVATGGTALGLHAYKCGFLFLIAGVHSITGLVSFALQSFLFGSLLQTTTTVAKAGGAFTASYSEMRFAVFDLLSLIRSE